MRASLASATSLLALLVFEARRAEAAPVTLSVNPDSASFGDVLVTPTASFSVSSNFVASASGGTGNVTFAAATGEFSPTTVQSLAPGVTQTATGTYTFKPTTTGSVTENTTVSYSSAQPVTLTLSGLGVAPVASVSSTVSDYALVQQATGFNVVVTNTGNGNLAAAGAGSNSSLASLTGAVGSASNSVFTGSGGTFSIQGTGSPTPTSSTFAYRFTPTSIGTSSATVTTTLNDGVGTNNASGTATTTLVATAVAPIESVSPTSASNLLRVGTSATSNITISNVGNGNMAGSGGAYNLNGSFSSALGTGFTAASGSTGTFSLADSHGTGSTSSTLGYTYTPLSRGTSASSVVTIAFSNGNAAGNNLSQTVAATISGSAVGPVFTSSLSGASGNNTPSAVANGSVGPASSTVSFGTLARSTNSLTVDLFVKNTTPDLPGTISTLTDLTIKSITLGGADPSNFTISSFAPGSVITAGGTLDLPITVIRGTASGILSSTLTIFTDESTGYGGVGDTFTYFLTANVPEPATIAVLGAGLAGLASVRRRLTRRRDPERA